MMVTVAVPCACGGLVDMHKIMGGTPYSATTLAGADGRRQTSANELNIARYQGNHGAKLVKKFAS